MAKSIIKITVLSDKDIKPYIEMLVNNHILDLANGEAQRALNKDASYNALEAGQKKERLKVVRNREIQKLEPQRGLLTQEITDKLKKEWSAFTQDYTRGKTAETFAKTVNLLHKAVFGHDGLRGCFAENHCTPLGLATLTEQLTDICNANSQRTLKEFGASTNQSLLLNRLLCTAVIKQYKNLVFQPEDKIDEQAVFLPKNLIYALNSASVENVLINIAKKNHLPLAMGEEDIRSEAFDFFNQRLSEYNLNYELPFDAVLRHRFNRYFVQDMRRKYQGRLITPPASASDSLVTFSASADIFEHPFPFNFPNPTNRNGMIRTRVNTVSNLVPHGNDRDKAGGGEKRIGEAIDHRQLSPLEESMVRENGSRVWDAVAKLHPQQRKVLEFYWRDELTLKEIADCLNLSESRVYKIKCQGMEKLRDMLTEHTDVHSGPDSQSPLKKSPLKGRISWRGVLDKQSKKGSVDLPGR
jgi:RNA polymerase sigma factor (sigma-70 family)